jgi:hypothetical protein
MPMQTLGSRFGQDATLNPANFMMKIQNALCCISAVWLGLLAVPCSAQLDSGIPHLRKQGAATQFVVDGKPFIALTGEIENEGATSLDNMKWMWPEFVKMNLNTLLPVAYWEMVEPEEGHWVAGRHLDHRVTTLDDKCSWCAAALLLPGAYKRRDTHSEHGILRVKLYRYQ